MTSRDIERRYLAQPVELRASTDGPGHLVGYAAVFESRSQDLGGFVEVVDRTAFNKSIADSIRVLCRFNHDNNALLGTSDAGTLSLSVDKIGLRYDVALPDTTVGRDVAVLAARGDLRNSSFAFECIDATWGVTERGFPERRLMATRLVDVAPVVNPAYLDSTTALRSLASHLGIAFELVGSKSTEEIRAMLTGEAPGDGPDDAPPNVESGADGDTANGDDDSEEIDSVADGSEQRETHSVPVAIRSRLMELTEKK